MSETSKPLVNHVANSALKTINLEKDYPSIELNDFDLKDYLFHELILKEKDFRSALKTFDWSVFKDQVVLIYCSTDAIIPVWAFMLVASYVRKADATSFHGTKQAYLENHYKELIQSRDYESFTGERVVIKGCSDKDVPEAAYTYLTSALQPFAQSIMYGEPCSTVPIFKRPRVV